MARNLNLLVKNFEETAQRVRLELKRSGFVLPVKHKDGIKYKHCYVIKNDRGWYDIRNLHNAKKCYKKDISNIKLAITAAIYLGNNLPIPNITEFDSVDRRYAHYHNEMIIFKHHYEISVKKGDDVRRDLFESRLAIAKDYLQPIKKEVDRILRRAEQLLFDTK